MKLPSFRRIFKNDYQADQQDLVDRLSVSINNGIEVLYDALNRKLTLSDNFNASVNTVTVEVNSSGSPLNTTNFKVDIDSTIMGILVINATNLTNSITYPTSTPFVSFTQNGQSINIVNITGLQAGNTYRLRLIAWGS